MKKAIIITGTPGTGKTAIGNLLKEHGYTVIDAGKYVVENSLYDFYDDKRESYVVNDQLLTAALIDEIENHKKDTPIIVEGHAFELPPSYIMHCLVLRCSIRLLRERLVERGYASSKIDENIEAEIMEVILTDMLNLCEPENVSVIFTDGAIDKTLEQILLIIREKLGD